MLTSAGRFTYIHLRSDTSLWGYADDQVDWSLEDLEDRVDPAVWDLIPPYQNEDDEGILPSHSHPSYPFGNPYGPNLVTTQVPQLARMINQPLAVGSSLLLNNFIVDPGQSYWTELATERLLRRPNLSSNLAEESHLEDLGIDPTEHQPASDLAQPHYPEASDQTAGLQTQTRTPAADEYRTPGQRTSDETGVFESDEEGQSAESAAIIEQNLVTR